MRDREPDPQGRTLASYGQRVAARLVDFVLVLLILALLVAAGVGTAASASNNSDGSSNLVGIVVFWVLVFVGFEIFYQVGAIAIWGVTAGKALSGIKVVAEESGDVPGWGPAFVRWLVAEGAILVPYVGWILLALVYLSPLWDRRLQSWADKAARTLVVNSHKSSS